MRLQTLITSAAIGGLAASLAACNTDTLTTYNKNPNAPERVPAELLFTNGVIATVGGATGLRTTSFEHGLDALWVQHYAEVQYPEADLFRPRSSTIDALWQGIYAAPLQDLRQVIVQTEDKGPIAGMATVMRAVNFQALTDLWGDIPFSQSGQGANATPVLAPKYDAQAVVYDSLIAELKAVPTVMAASGPAISNPDADPVYGGSTAKWTKFANSLRARLAMRAYLKDPAKYGPVLADALTGPVFASNADNAYVYYPGNGVLNNPLYNNWRTRDDQRLSRTFVDTLKQLGDPRLAAYARETIISQDTSCMNHPGKAGCEAYVGAQNGLNASPGAIPTTSRPDTVIRMATSPSILMTYSEVLFIRAEALVRGVSGVGTGGFARVDSVYAAAIRASIDQWAALNKELLGGEGWTPDTAQV